jgi:site-specific DNA recombinase
MIIAKPDFKKIRVALYVRVSTQEQAKEGYSVGEQTDRLRKFAEAHDWCIVKVYTDAGHSGANTDRPALQQMIDDLKAGKIDKVLVYKLDRLSRSQKDTLELIEDVFLPNGTDFESMTEKLDTSTPQGRLFLGILAAFAQLEREMIRERMSMGMYARVKEGKWRGGNHIPFGYDYEPALEKLVVNEYESMIVKNLFEDFTEGMPLYTITNKMIKNGHMLHNGKVDRRNLRYILRNKTYCGYMKYQDEYIKGLHDPIIDEETYEKAQAILDVNKERFERAGYKTGTAAQTTHLGGLLYCARCGAKYSKSKSGSNIYGYHTNYTCYSRHKRVKTMIKDPNCKNKIYRMDDLDNIIFNEIKKLAVDPEYIDQLKKESEKLEDVQKIHAIEQKIKSIDAQISRFMDLYGLGNYDIDQLDKKTAPLNEQRTKLKKELETLQENSKRITEPEVRKLVESFDEVLEKADLQQTRCIIEQLIDRIIIDGDDITIHWNFI